MAARLSDMQQRLLRFLRHTEGRGYLPTTAEIRDAVGIPTIFAVHRELDDLQAKGVIARDPNRPNSIVILLDSDLPAAWEQPPVQVPLLGSIAAGRPVMAEENVEEDFWLPRELVGYGDDLFMLRTRGESMIEAGIHDGDYVVVHAQNTAASGDIVVARVGDETTVKRLSVGGGQTLLVPANPAYDPIAVGADVRIVGKVIVVIRTL